MSEQRDDADAIVAAGLTAAQVAALPTRDRVPMDDFIEMLEADARRVTEQAARGEITVSQWEAEMRRIIKVAHNGAALAGRAGEPMGIVERLLDWARRQRRIAEQFDYLHRFGMDLLSGRYDDESQLGSVIGRALLYVGAAWLTYSMTAEKVARKRGLREKRRVLEPGARHCTTCLEQAALGWVSIDDPRVTGIGEDTLCGHNDRCIIDYR